MDSDRQLLSEYARTHSQEAFRQLVCRHLDWVYSSTLRQVRDPHLAEDVTQAVFLLLSQKAHSIPPAASIGGWLFRTTQYAARGALRSERRRQTHEQRAAAMASVTTEPDVEAAWQDLAPALDAAVGKLSAGDREAILLRFYQRQDLASIAETLQISEEGARRRIARAVEKLRAIFARQHITLSATLLVAVLDAHTAFAAPSSLAYGVLAATHGGPMAADAAVPALTRLAARALMRAKIRVAVMLLLVGALTTTAGVLAAQQLLSGSVPTTPPASPQETNTPSPRPQWRAEGQLNYARWHCLIEAPVANRIRAIAQPMRGATTPTAGAGPSQMLEALTCDAEQLASLVRTGMQASPLRVASPYALSWRDHLVHDAGQAVRGDRWHDFRVQPEPPANHFVELSSTKQQITVGLNGMRITVGPVSLSCSAQATATVASGEALVFLGHLGQLDDLDLHYLLVYQILKTTPEQQRHLSRYQDATGWLRHGTAQMQRWADQAVKWEAQARLLQPPPDKAWTRQLPGGSTVRLLAIADPNDNPFLWWTPDGGPIAIDRATTAIRTFLPDVTHLAIVQPIDLVRPDLDQDILVCQHGETTITTGAGDGTYTKAGELALRPGSEFNLNGAVYRIENVQDHGGQVGLVLTYTRLTDTDVQLVLVDRLGKTHFATSGAGAARERATVAHVPYAYQVPLSNVARVEVHTRPHRWVTFNGFAPSPTGPHGEVPAR